MNPPNVRIFRFGKGSDRIFIKECSFNPEYSIIIFWAFDEILIIYFHDFSRVY